MLKQIRILFFCLLAISFYGNLTAQNTCGTAVTLVANDTCIPGSLYGAPSNGPAIGFLALCVRNAHVQWYRYVSISTAPIRVELDVTSSGSDTDLGFVVWDVACGSVSNSNEVICEDAHGNGEDEAEDITTGVTIGRVYLIRVSGNGNNDMGNYCIKVSQSVDNPCNAPVQAIQDGCNSALSITRYNVSGSTQTFPASSTSCSLDGDNDIFFRLVAPASGTFAMYVNDWGDYGAITSANLTANLYEGSCNSLSIAGPPETVEGNAGMNNPASPGCIDISQGTFNTVNNGPFIFENLTPGQDYYVRITEEDDQSAWVELAFQEALLEDDCITAQPLTGTGCNYSATNINEPSGGNWTGQAHTDGRNVNTIPGGDDIDNCNTNWFSNENMVWYYFDVDAFTVQPISISVYNIDCNNTGGGQLQMGVWYANGASCAPSGGASNTNGLGAMVPVGCNVGPSGALSVTLPDNMPHGRYYVVMDGDAGAQCTWEFISPQVLPTPLFESFEGWIVESANQLEWKTITDFQAEKFLVERALGASGEFEIIGTVKAGMGLEYSYIDEVPASHSFYRIKAIDKNGELSSSATIEISRIDVAFSLLAFYPNPTHNILTIEVDAPLKKEINYQVSDLMGKSVHHGRWESTLGLQTQTLDVSQLSSGVYMITLEQNGSVIHKKFVKE